MTPYSLGYSHSPPRLVLYYIQVRHVGLQDPLFWDHLLFGWVEQDVRHVRSSWVTYRQYLSSGNHNGGISQRRGNRYTYYSTPGQLSSHRLGVTINKAWRQSQPAHTERGLLLQSAAFFRVFIHLKWESGGRPQSSDLILGCSLVQSSMMAFVDQCMLGTRGASYESCLSFFKPSEMMNSAHSVWQRI